MGGKGAGAHLAFAGQFCDSSREPCLTASACCLRLRARVSLLQEAKIAARSSADGGLRPTCASAAPMKVRSAGGSGLGGASGTG